jgi:hypothetical protein
MRFRILTSILLIVILALLLAWISSSYGSVQGWSSFLVVLLMSTSFLWLIWRALYREHLPNWLCWLFIGGVLLRLGAAVLWWVVLPIWGHGTEAELSGYVMADAFQRDTQAWVLSQSGEPLWRAFLDYRLADQYGGMLFLSSGIYRYFGGQTHQPLLMSVITAAFSGTAILFAWSFTRRLWGSQAAKAAAWVLCLYPEAVLLGSSQMREAFMMTLVGMAFFGLLSYWQDRKSAGLIWMVVAFLVSVPLSYLFAIMLMGFAILMTLILNGAYVMRHWGFWMVLGILLLVISVVWLVDENIYPEGASNPWELIHQWLVYAARWEERTAAISSGWLNKVFKRTPEWMDVWIILGYGLFQPFLPAAFLALGNWVWRLIAIWRSIGWTFLLVFLFYAPIRAWVKIRKEYLAAAIGFLVWVGILISAYRGGADQWDNPRYRVSLVVLQVALTGWVWSNQHVKPDPWFRRIIIGTGLVLAWFIPWYLRRYTVTFNWPVIDLFKTLGFGFTTAILYWLWDWVRSQDVAGD